MTLLDLGSQVFLFAADHAGNKVCEVVFGRLKCGWTGFLISSQPAPVTGGVVDGQVPLRSVKNIAHRVVISLHRAELSLRGFARGAIEAGSNLSLVVRYPMANLKLQHRAFPIGAIVLEATV